VTQASGPVRLTADQTTLGVRLPNSGPIASPDNMIETGELADRVGYHAVWVHDHISWPPEELTHITVGSQEACHGQDPNFYESVTSIAVLGARLQRAAVGIAGLAVPLRDPRVLAKQLTTVEHLVGPGRVVVACGAGAKQVDFNLMGVEWKRRGRLTNDYLGAMRAIFDQPSPVEYAGETVSFAGGHFYPPTRDVQLWSAGNSEFAIKRALRFGTGWMTSWATPDEYRVHKDTVRRLADEVGRNADELVTALDIFTTVAETHQEAEDIAARTLTEKFGSLERGVEVSLVGTADEVADRILEFRDAGVRHFGLKFVCHDVRRHEAGRGGDRA
jgi:alkanesulfonate monooxygenase SsuD/methylene tetrahydromethanopterin reductase-like flavin-dependent oxidoreductase (luciferase family)